MNKTIKLAAAVAVLFGAHFGAQAQSAPAQNEVSGVSLADARKYSRFIMSYEMTGFTTNEEAHGSFNGKDSRYLNGFGLALMHGEKLPHNIPLYIEFGLKFHMGFWGKEERKSVLGSYYTLTQRMQNMTFTVPLNINYRIKFSERMYIAPFVGLNMKVNAMLRSRGKYSDNYYKDFGIDKDKASKWHNYLSPKDENGNETTEEPWKVIQFGWQAGVAFTINDLNLGVSYGTDFIPACKSNKARINSSTLSISLAVPI